MLPRVEHEPSTEQRKQMLIIADDLIGDALVRMPLYASLRVAFPRSEWHISIAVTSSVARLFARLPYFDSIVESPGICNCCHSILWFLNRRYKVNSLLKWARQHRVDILLNLVRVRSLGYDYMVRILKPKAAFAYDTSTIRRQYPMTGAYQERCCDMLYTHLIPVKAGTPQTDDLKTFLKCVVGSAWRLAPVATDDLTCMLDPCEEQPVRPYIVVVPGASMLLRRWPLERFACVVDRLIPMMPPGATAVAVGTRQEADLGAALDRMTSGRIRNLCGRTTLSELGSLLKGASLVVTNETGTATYAAVMGAPTVCIVGGGDFRSFFPTSFYKNTASVFREAHCFFCGWHCIKGDGNHVAPCIQSVTPDEVVAAALKLLGRD